MTMKHIAAGNILRSGKMYFKGDPIEFDDSEADHVAELLAHGALAGPVADEHEMLRIYNEMQTKMKGMNKEEQMRLWRTYLRMDEEQRKLREQAEARAKTDADAARRANEAEATPKAGPAEDEEIAAVVRAKK